MIAVITGRTRRLYSRPPNPPYVLNSDCIQAQGLVAFWPMGEPSARSYYNYARRGLDLLTQTGTMTLGPGPGGSDLAPGNTGATGNYLSVSRAIVTAVPFTFANWFLAASTTAFMNLIIVSDTVGNAYFNYGLATLTAGTVHAGTNDNNAETTTTYSVNTWNHACGVYNGVASRSAFLNGGGKATNTTSSTPSGLNLTELGGFINTYGMLNGRMTHACIWDRALSDTEVWLLYEPKTRWDLYYQPGRKTYSIGAPAAGGRTTRNTLASPLGVHLGRGLWTHGGSG